MTEEEKYELIESYLQGNLTAEELKAFEQKLASDTVFQQEVQLHKDLSLELEDTKAVQFSQQLKKIDKNWKAPVIEAPVEKKSPPRRSIIRYIAAIAASLLLGIFLYKGFFQSVSNDTLFADHFEPYKMILTQRNSNQSPDDIDLKLNQATQAYNQNDFAKAAILFNEMSQDGMNKPVYRFYYAQSLLASNQLPLAIHELEKLSEIQGSMLQEHAVWYLGLAYLQMDEKLAAKETFTKISPTGYQYESAQKILAKLK